MENKNKYKVCGILKHAGGELLLVENLLHPGKILLLEYIREPGDPNFDDLPSEIFTPGKEYYLNPVEVKPDLEDPFNK